MQFIYRPKQVNGHAKGKTPYQEPYLRISMNLYCKSLAGNQEKLQKIQFELDNHLSSCIHQ